MKKLYEKISALSIRFVTTNLVKTSNPYIIKRKLTQITMVVNLFGVRFYFYFRNLHFYEAKNVKYL